LKTETISVIISFLCFFFSINFAVLSVYVIVDEGLRAQLVTAATSFFVGGAVIAVLLIVLKTIARASKERNES
jgi:hypothetical protein